MYLIILPGLNSFELPKGMMSPLDLTIASPANCSFVMSSGTVTEKAKPSRESNNSTVVGDAGVSEFSKQDTTRTEVIMRIQLLILKVVIFSRTLEWMRD